MLRRSRLGVLVRLARLEESARLRAFGATRRALEELEQQLQTARRALDASSTAHCLGQRRAVSVEELRGLGRHARWQSDQSALLTRDRDAALERLESARHALAGARLRRRALEDAEQRRAARAARAQAKREVRRLDEAQRGIDAARDRHGARASSDTEVRRAPH